MIIKQVNHHKISPLLSERVNAGGQVPVKKIDYQYLNQNNNLYVLKKSPVLGANNDNITPVKKHAQVKLSVKPPWWG